jgi:hypothetical protein
MLTKLSGLFTNLNNTLLNAVSGFDADVLREVCRKNGITPNFDINKRNTKNEKKKVNTLDYQVYKERFSIEQFNAWGDGYKTLAVRHETSAIN